MRGRASRASEGNCCNMPVGGPVKQDIVWLTRFYFRRGIEAILGDSGDASGPARAKRTPV